MLAPRPTVVKNATISGACSVGIEPDRDPAGHSEAKSHGGEQEPADDGRRDVVGVEDADALADPVADEQQDGGQRQRLDHVEVERRGACRHGRCMI